MASSAVTVKVKAVPAVALAGALTLKWVAGAGTVATCTAAPLLTPLAVTTAVREPETSPLRLATVSWVLVADVTVPVAPLLKVTTLWLAVGSKPTPAMVKLVELAGNAAVLEVTLGRTPLATVEVWLSTVAEAEPNPATVRPCTRRNAFRPP